MKRKSMTAICLAVTLISAGCSTKPRNFSASVRPIAAGSAAGNLDDAFGRCNVLVRKGYKGNFAAAAASGAVGGAAMFGGAAAVAASGTVGITGATSAGYALSAAVPVLGIAATFGVNRAIRAGRERKYKRTMTLCMQQLGFDVVDWTRINKKQQATATLAAAAPAPEATPTAPGPLSTQQ